MIRPTILVLVVLAAGCGETKKQEDYWQQSSSEWKAIAKDQIATTKKANWTSERLFEMLEFVRKQRDVAIAERDAFERVMIEMAERNRAMSDHQETLDAANTKYKIGQQLRSIAAVGHPDWEPEYAAGATFKITHARKWYDEQWYGVASEDGEFWHIFRLEDFERLFEGAAP